MTVVGNDLICKPPSTWLRGRALSLCSSTPVHWFGAARGSTVQSGRDDCPDCQSHRVR
jgi:hypothetical protein